MKHLNRSIMEDYEILSSRPERLCAVQFGADARLLGGVDRMLDEANRARTWALRWWTRTAGSSPGI